MDLDREHWRFSLKPTFSKNIP